MCIRDRREVAEELGLTGEIVSLIGVYGFESRNEVIVAYHAVSYTHLRAHETVLDIVCRLLLDKKKQSRQTTILRQQSVHKDEHLL